MKLSKIYLFLLIILILIPCKSQLNPNMSDISNRKYLIFVDCDLSDEDLNNNLDTIRMTETDAIFIMVITPISVLCLLFVITTSFYHSKLLESPGDIILALSFNELVKIITYFINAIYYFRYPNGPKTNSSFCQLTGNIMEVSHFIEDYYNMVFCLLILLKIRYLLKDSYIPRLVYHSLLLVMTSITCFFWVYYNRIGKYYTGVCGLKACFNFWSKVITIMQTLNIILVILTLRYFIKRLPSYSNIRKIKTEILKYLLIYLIGQTITRITYQIFLVLLEINSSEWKSERFRSFQFMLHFKLIITPFLLLLMRYNHLFFSEIFRKIFFCQYFYFLFPSPPPQQSELLTNDLDKSLDLSNSYTCDKDQIRNKIKSADTKNKIPEKPAKMSLEDDLSSLKRNLTQCNQKRESTEKNEVGFFSINIISFNMKIMLTRSILTGIWIAHKEAIEEEKEEVKKNEKYTFSRVKTNPSNMFLEIKRIPINNDQTEKTKSLFELTMIIYAPRMFKSLLSFDKDMINFEDSLALCKNDENIKKANKTDGGKSGQFFFCSHDNKLIIKTLSTDELQIFLKNLEDYYNYLTTHKDSLITKIYGVYTFVRKDIDISNHVIIMRNIVNTSKKNIIVSYDLKGSTFDREVLKEMKSMKDKSEAYEKKLTLKDSDFLKFENQIEIIPYFKEKLIKTLKEDTHFFRKMGFMDYSLFLVKVKKDKRLTIFGEINETECNPLYSIESVKERGIYYNIGIIDYFQKYTVKKFFEKYFKKFVHANSDLDTSSQNPKFYALRFMNFMEKIIE